MNGIIYHRSKRDIESGSPWKYDIRFIPEIKNAIELYGLADWCKTNLKNEYHISWYDILIMDDDDLMRYCLRWDITWSIR